LSDYLTVISNEKSANENSNYQNENIDVNFNDDEEVNCSSMDDHYSSEAIEDYNKNIAAAENNTDVFINQSFNTPQTNEIDDFNNEDLDNQKDELIKLFQTASSSSITDDNEYSNPKSNCKYEHIININSGTY
jgi:hypothetical protein